MSGDARADAERAAYPPDWVDDAEAKGDPGLCVTWSTTSWGAARLELWRSLGPTDPAELGWALSPIPTYGGEATARALAIRAARTEHAGLSDETWADLVDGLALPVAQRTEAAAIASAVARRIAASAELLGAAVRADRRDRTAPALSARQAESARWASRARELRETGLTIAQVAIRLSGERGVVTSPRTVSWWLARKNL